VSKTPRSLPAARGPESTGRGRPLCFMPTALAVALSGALALPGAALAADWTGSVSNDWLVGGNWSTGVPGSADDVSINTGPPPSLSGAGASGLAKNVFVGDTNVGGLAILNGAQLSGSSGLIGFAAGTSGQVVVGGVAGGVGASWINSASINVGVFGSGTLAILNGGLVSAGASGFLGTQVGASGVVTVDGPGSGLTIGTTFLVGNFGSGTLMISNAGVVNDAQGILANQPNSSGAVTVDGAGSTWTNTANLNVGRRSAGTLSITNGGAVSNVDGTVGQFVAEGNGTVTVDGAGSAWNNSGNLRVGDGGTGVLTVANGGNVVVGGLLSVGAQVGSTGTVNIGGAAGAAPAAPGTLSTAIVNFGDGSGTLNFNHTDTSGNYAFGLPFAGPGTINQVAGWTKLTVDSNTFTGQANVTGGRLAVNAALANAQMNVSGTGILGGTGTVGNTFANAGGTIAPGNSIGTLNVNGNVSFAAGSFYQVETNPAGQSDKLLVSGTATINGGTVQVIGGTGTYNPATSYSILTAGTVTGSFTNVTSDLVYQDASLSYSANDVTLTLTRNSTPMGSVGQTPGQVNTGTGVQGLGTGSGNALYNAVLGLSAAQARNAFQQLSGEVHASARGVVMEDSHFSRDASLERLRALDSEVVANDGGADDGSKAGLLPSVRDLAYWARAMGSWGHTDGDGNAATVKRDTSGFLMGADTRFGEEGRFGLMGGYSRSAFDVTDRNASGSSDNYHLGAYAGSRFGDLALRTGVSYSWHDVSTSRAVAFPGFTDSLKADYKANTTQAFAELGYRIKTERAELEPFVNLAHVNVSSDGFTERGGLAALTGAGDSSGTTFSTVGLRASTNFALDGGTSVTARGSLGWRHASGDVTPTIPMAFAGGLPFPVAGAPIARSAAVVEAGLDFKLTNAATLGLSYGGQFGSGLKDHSARIQLNVAF
jgi:outer membrane autotransporter protein